MNSILFLCTGNAARSVIAGVALRRRRPDLHIETAGTLTVNGMPISWRTRAALTDVGLPWPKHASRQADRADLHGADLVVALAPEHVEWVRREHSDASGKTATLIRLTRQLPAPTAPFASLTPLTDRVGLLGLATVELERWEEVVDPGGGDVDAFIACAREVVALVDQLAELL